MTPFYSNLEKDGRIPTITRKGKLLWLNLLFVRCQAIEQLALYHQNNWKKIARNKEPSFSSKILQYVQNIGSMTEVTNYFVHWWAPPGVLKRPRGFVSLGLLYYATLVRLALKVRDKKHPLCGCASTVIQKTPNAEQ